MTFTGRKTLPTYSMRRNDHIANGCCVYQVGMEFGLAIFCPNEAPGEKHLCSEHLLDLSDPDNPKGKQCAIPWCKKQAIATTWNNHEGKEEPKCDIHSAQFN
ncbi:MAG: hypothetical protein V4611_04190 [Patescibacteria group bacterium]